MLTEAGTLLLHFHSFQRKVSSILTWVSWDHLQLLFQWLTMTSTRFPMERHTTCFTQSIHLQQLSRAKLRGAIPQIEQGVNRSTSPQSLVFTYGPQAQRN